MYGRHPLALAVKGQLSDADEVFLHTGLVQSQAGGGDNQGDFGGVSESLILILCVIVRQQNRVSAHKKRGAGYPTGR